jgi:hypothetical protein
MRLRDKYLYPHRSDLYEKNFYKCSCGAYVGCHPNTNIALGNPCGPQTRKARNLAHQAIDPIWKNSPLSRNEVYRRLAQKLNIRREVCHVAHMTAPEAFKAAQAAEEIGKEAS